MKPRLFWTMLLSFALVILLGICGMLGFFGLAFSGVWQPPAVAANMERMETSYATTLGDFYVANGDSWAGIDARLEMPPPAGPGMFASYAVADRSGRVIASTDERWSVGEVVDPKTLGRSAPVKVHGEQVGTLVARAGPPFGPAQTKDGRAPVNMAWAIIRSFVIAGLLLAGGLLVLAVLFAKRLSRPLRDMTQAAKQLATGRLDVQVQPAPIRELNELAVAFNGMARSLSEADRQRRQMTADIAHELRTPLTIIKGRLEGLQDGVYTASAEELDRLLHETALLERLIEDLRLLALAEAGQLPLHREVIDPRELLETTRAAFAGQAAAHSVTIALDAADDLPPIDADPQRIAQVLANLVANALRYTPEGGTITLAAHSVAKDPRPKTKDQPALRNDGDLSANALVVRPSSAVVFGVADTGKGIAEADLPHIFDRFYRADRSRTRVSGGAGLGLAIAKQIVASHGGEIWAESAEGQGTTINMSLPIAQSEIPVPASLPLGLRAR